MDDKNIQLGMILLAILGAASIIGTILLRLWVEGVDVSDLTQLAAGVVGAIAGVLIGKRPGA